MRHIEQSLVALDTLHLGVGEKLSLWAIVDSYVFGSALQAVESLTRATAAQRNPRVVADAIAFGEQQLGTGQFPRLAALYRRSGTGHAAADDAGASGPPMTTELLASQFEKDLMALLDGLVPTS
jgi:hypothetical protein